LVELDELTDVVELVVVLEESELVESVLADEVDAPGTCDKRFVRIVCALEVSPDSSAEPMASSDDCIGFD